MTEILQCCLSMFIFNMRGHYTWGCSERASLYIPECVTKLPTSLCHQVIPTSPYAHCGYRPNHSLHNMSYVFWSWFGFLWGSCARCFYQSVGDVINCCVIRNTCQVKLNNHYWLVEWTLYEFNCNLKKIIDFKYSGHIENWLNLITY
jgi:hypothetical protein